MIIIIYNDIILFLKLKSFIQYPAKTPIYFYIMIFSGGKYH